ncbi:Arachidonate 5-lipoxygenase [Mactra antiquata]
MRRRSSAFAGSFHYTVYVKTGDRPNAGTDANVYIILHGENGIKSKEMKLDVLFHDDFERGNLDKFKLKHQSFSNIDCIEIWRDTHGFNSDWHVDTIMVVNQETRTQTVFPIFRWIRPNYRYKFYPLDTSLPQEDDRKEQRKLELEEKRELYELESRAPGLPPQIKNIPSDEISSMEFRWDITKMRKKLSVTSRIVQLTTSRWSTMNDIKNIYTKKAFAKPSDMNRWNSDFSFGQQRLSGVNNVFIRTCHDIPEKLPVTDEMLEPFLEGLSLPLALSDRRIFIIDYEILQDCPKQEDVHVCAPIALFFQTNDKTLVPIAIQLAQKPADDNPIFLPSDPDYTWTLAKMWFNNADACIHQAVIHLGFTHMTMEGIAIITHRQLSRSHPVFKLLAPHLLYLIGINAHAEVKIMGQNGWIEEVMAIGVDGFYELIKRYKAKWRMDVDGTLPSDLYARGVEDPETLPTYYFRNDALMVYETILNYVRGYLKLYYDNEEKVLEDFEIQNWRQEMVKPLDEHGLGLQGVPGESGKFVSRENVVSVCVFIIYTCSVGHATSLKQYDEYAFPPNYPTILRGTPPTSKEPLTEEHILESLPDKTTSMNVMIITKILSQKVSKSLGDFDVNYVYDPRAIEVIKGFREELKKITSTIKYLNKSRLTSYTYLDPVNVPNAISI